MAGHFHQQVSQGQGSCLGTPHLRYSLWLSLTLESTWRVFFFFLVTVYLDTPPPPKIGELLVTSSRKWKLMCSHPKHFILFVLSFISLPGLLLLFPLLNDLLDCILLRNKGSAFLAGILGRPPRTLAHAVQFRTTFNNNKNAWLNGSKMWSVRGIHLSLGHCHNTDRPK